MMRNCIFRVAFGTHFRVTYDEADIVQVDLYASHQAASLGTAAGLIAEDCDYLQMTQAQRDLLHFACAKAGA